MIDSTEVDIQELGRLLKKKFSGIKIGEHKPMIFLPTGLANLDAILGGGLPSGRLVEIYGPEHSGKTTLCCHFIKSFQQRGYACALIDAERAIPVEIMSVRCGIDKTNLVYLEESIAEKILEFLIEFFGIGGKLAIIDSLAAIQTRTVFEEEDYGKANVGGISRFISQHFPKLIDVVNEHKGVVVFTNQIRDKIGVTYGNPETTSSGHASKHYMSLRLRISRGQALPSGDGHQCKIKVIKDRQVGDGGECFINILRSTGVDEISSLFEACVTKNIISRTGAWYKLGMNIEGIGELGHQLGQGGDKVIQLLKAEPDVYKAMYQALVNSNRL
jgi:recombination protein RecA